MVVVLFLLVIFLVILDFVFFLFIVVFFFVRDFLSPEGRNRHAVEWTAMAKFCMFSAHIPMLHL